MLGSLIVPSLLPRAPRLNLRTSGTSGGAAMNWGHDRDMAASSTRGFLAGEIMALRQRMQGLAHNVFMDD